MSKDGAFKHESMQDAESILAYIDALRDGLATGKLRLAAKDRELILEPKGLMRLVVEAKRKDNRLKLELKLTWKDQDDPDLSDENLEIEAV